jgi:tripartite-type tricarboxylate transporter receptor subunit TctC
MLALDRIVYRLSAAPSALHVTWVLAAAVLTLSQASAHADDYPSRTVTIVAPAAPGGLYSLFARLIGSKLEQRLGKTFIVENRPGASSIIGILSVIHAAHDGYTLIVANNTGMAINVTTQKQLPYDPQKDLAPVALIARIPEVLVVDAALPVRSIGDLAELAKATLVA